MTNIRSAVAVAALLCAPALAFAQTPQSPAATPPAANRPAAAAPAPNKDIEAKVEQRINQLHAQLKITSAQEDEWKKFADVMRGNARDMEGVIEQRMQEYPQMNALQNMQSYQKVAQAHADHLEKLATAFQSLYDALPQPQKQIADQVFKAKMTAQPQHASTSPAGRRAE